MDAGFGSSLAGDGVALIAVLAATGVFVLTRRMLRRWGGTTAQRRILEEMIKRLGFDGVELPIFNTNLDYAAWGKKLDSLGLGRTAVTVRGVEDNPISPDASVRAQGVENTKRVLDCCAAVGATTLVGPYHSALGAFSGKGPTADEWHWGIESMRQVAEHAGKVHVTLGVEALNRFETYLLNTHADSAKFVREVNHPNCRMMYDTFHANIEEKNLAAAMQSCWDQVVHVHISENDRSTPGEGHVDWATTFKTLKELGSVEKTLSQFKGRTIGTPTKGSIHDVIIRNLLEKSQLQEEVKIRNSFGASYF